MAIRHNLIMGFVDQSLWKKIHHFQRDPVLTETYIQMTLAYPNIQISVTLIHPHHLLVTLTYPSQMVVTIKKMTKVGMIQYLCILMEIKFIKKRNPVPGGGKPRKKLIQYLQQPALVP